MSEFVKSSRSAPEGFFACEASGLRWLSEVPGGAPCVPVLCWDETSLALQRLESASPSAAAAAEFGSRLALTHNAGAAGFGAAPPSWTGPGFFGPLADPLPMSLNPHDSWGVFYAAERLVPMLERAGSSLDTQTHSTLEMVITRCRAGQYDDDEGPSRLHGDLWAGNVMWTPDGAVLIDPAAHGGHRETDLAMLALFGCPHIEDIFAGYHRVHPLRPGWRDRFALHQLYPLLAHVVLFGGGYAGQVAAAARAALDCG